MFQFRTNFLSYVAYQCCKEFHILDLEDYSEDVEFSKTSIEDHIVQEGHCFHEFVVIIIHLLHISEKSLLIEMLGTLHYLYLLLNN